MEKKYKLLENDTIMVNGRALYRIEALKDFADVRKGDRDGYVEKEDNLSHDGICWVYDNARVYGDACVSGNAWVYGNARVYGDAWVYDNARVDGEARISVTADYYVGKNIWSSGRYFTYTRSDKMWKVGCFHGTGEELIRKAYQDGVVSGREYERVVRYVEAMYADLEKDKSKE